MLHVPLERRYRKYLEGTASEKETTELIHFVYILSRLTQMKMVVKAAGGVLRESLSTLSYRRDLVYLRRRAGRRRINHWINLGIQGEVCTPSIYKTKRTTLQSPLQRATLECSAGERGARRDWFGKIMQGMEV